MSRSTIDRKEFLTLMAGASGLSTLGCSLHDSGPARVGTPNSPDPSGSSEQARTAAFAERVVDDVSKALFGAMSYLGDRLGLFKAMADMDACTVEELAERSACHPRLVQEWLSAMVAAQYVEYQPQTRRYRLPAEHAAVLADEESPFFMGGLIEGTVPNVMVTHKVMDAFRTGVPITPDVFHPNIWEATERGSAPLYKHQLVQQWLPTMPNVVRRLEAGGSAADVGCGAGRASITIAKAFPRATTVGYDPHAPSIERAREQARANGVAERAQFVVGGAKDLPVGRFDLVSAFWVVHHMAKPIEDFTAIRRALAPDGSFLIMEDNISVHAHENTTSWGVFVYAASTLHCLHDSMADNGAGLGSLAEPQARQLAEQAGFGQFRRLPVQDATIALYELKA